VRSSPACASAESPHTFRTVPSVSPLQIAAAVVAVLIAAGAVWQRDKLSGERKLLAAVLVLALAIYASGVLSALPDPKAIIDDIAQALGAWTYALVGVMAYLETGAFVGLVAPGETVVIAGGVIAGQGEIDLVPLIGLVWICAVLGDTTSFYLGRRLGRRFLERHGPRVKITPERLTSVEGYFDRHGGKTILVGRFIGLVRALAPFIAGTSGLAFRRFIPYSIVGTGLWATTFCVLGYIFWRSFDQVAHLAGQAIFGFGVTVGVIVGIVVAYRRRAEIGAWILAHERHPLIRPLLAVWRPLQRRVFGPLARAIVPKLRFLWERLTPGGLGLELTTAVAAGAVGLYVFGLYAVILSGDLNATPLDRELLDLGDRMRSEAAVDVAKIVSGFGSFAACATVVAATSILLALRRRIAEIVVLVLGFALIYLCVHLAKAGIDRPRPAAPLTDADSSAFPSGHAAYATAWIASAVVFTRRLGLVHYATLVTGAIALAAAVGLSRIYLRVHYWSDVAGGWGLGIGIFGTLAAIAMLVQHMRHNDGERAPRPIARARR
jgi:membrane protein DedA with SNARE-associated domain/membrane-associated phospholipid phosphatase